MTVTEQRGGESQWLVLSRSHGFNMVKAEQTQVIISIQKQLICWSLRKCYFASLPSGGAHFPVLKMGVTVPVRKPHLYPVLAVTELLSLSEVICHNSFLGNHSISVRQRYS